jgi:hypothetical protein
MWLAGYFTVKATIVDAVIDPEVAVTVIMYRPAVVPGLVVPPEL